nr:MAG TPA: hypothetical protein [Crassvirales sp.]
MPNLTARSYIDSIFTIHFVSIILTIWLYSIHFFIPSYQSWNLGTLYYSLLSILHTYFGSTSRRTPISLQNTPYHVCILPQCKFFVNVFQLV